MAIKTITMVLPAASGNPDTIRWFLRVARKIGGNRITNAKGNVTIALGKRAAHRFFQGMAMARGK